MKSILTRCRSKFILSYIEGFNVYKKKYQKTRIIEAGDYVLYSSVNKESMTPINSYIVFKSKETLLGRDGTIRSLKLNIAFGGPELNIPQKQYLNLKLC